jgi:colicin import membrane protein
LSEQPTKTGLVFSGVLHATLLAFILVGFASAPRFDDASESIPVDTVPLSEFNQIMKGERDAKPAKPVEQPPQPKPAIAAAPTPPTEPAKAESPPVLKHIDEIPPPPEPPTRPETTAPKPEAAKTPPTPPEPDNAEVIKPKPAAEANSAPTPQPPARPKTPDRPKEPAPEKPKIDVVAKLVEKTKADEQPKPATRNMDLSAIAKIIGATKSAPEQQSANATPFGSPTQNAPRMSPSLSAALDGWLTEAYLNCWQTPPTMPDGERYIAQIRVTYNPDGSLSAQPVLVNPPSDPAWRAYAESAKRAVLKCNPLHVPPQFAPYYEQWRSKTVHFDPQSALG